MASFVLTGQYLLHPDSGDRVPASVSIEETEESGTLHYLELSHHWSRHQLRLNAIEAGGSAGSCDGSWSHHVAV